MKTENFLQLVPAILELELISLFWGDHTSTQSEEEIPLPPTLHSESREPGSRYANNAGWVEKEKVEREL